MFHVYHHSSAWTDSLEPVAEGLPLAQEVTMCALQLKTQSLTVHWFIPVFEWLIRACQTQYTTLQYIIFVS